MFISDFITYYNYISENSFYFFKEILIKMFWG